MAIVHSKSCRKCFSLRFAPIVSILVFVGHFSPAQPQHCLAFVDLTDNNFLWLFFIPSLTLWVCVLSLTPELTSWFFLSLLISHIN
ncbi:uncharacterized protein BO87DRAFT_242000 [Aspergillus neoniger CBS 115656]|uniref:Uncharacterized protein n=1 Tax=Aspergillus neoniger (strain CBS 115656) TaxID=1448310 RepID=A0A318ZKT2_ASPNB|nr:hypothetical protein BO87DRAFT_242000 [Aspergillus neoniger CBS 115656]PYH36552.1 hypothetical protein BO87DRAFT_242000 [Aspergillus neoniger CBS 115656]